MKRNESHFKGYIFCVLALAVILCPTATFADIVYVPGDEPTIQAGIDAASDGDIVLVADGTYVGEGNKDLDFNGKAIKVQSENGSDNCIIDCEGDGRGFYFHSAESSDARVDGFTIKNSYIDRSDGGAVYCSGSSPTILNNIMINNTAFGNGGGIYCENSSATILNNTITDNFARFGDGGGIFCCYSSPAILNNMITNNACHSSSHGGGIYCHSSSPTMTNNAIVRNKAARGGGIYLNSSSLTMANNTICDNSAGLHAGGGIYCDSSSLAILNTIIWGNPPDSIYCNADGGHNTITISYSDIQGGQAGIVTNAKGTVNWGGGNINTAALFIEPTCCNYGLSDYSPCIGAGTSTGAPETDIEGNPRGTPPDMGAYENPLNVPLTRLPITIHVSVDGNDDTGDGSIENPYRTIQKGIDVAIKGDTILVGDGRYAGTGNNSPDFCGKAIVVKSENGASTCIIDCENNAYGFHFHSGESLEARVDGFTIQEARVFGGILCQASSPTIINNKIFNNARGLSCYDNSSPVITNNAIFDNTSYGILCGSSSPTIKNNTITKNNDFGIYSMVDSRPTVFNTILWGNGQGAISGNAEITYSDVEGSWAGEGNINVNPLFVDPARGEYHLSDYSLCIGAGTSTGAPETDIEGNQRGTLPDMGAYENPLNVPLSRTPITVHVSVDGNDDTGDGTIENPYRTIQKGIDVAIASDTVLVANGVYTGHGNRDIDFDGKNITLKSKHGASGCIIDCQGIELEPHRGFYFHSGEASDARVDGFTIQNGYTWHGAGIYCDGASPTIINNVITNNTAYSSTITPSCCGGGICCFNSSAIIVNNVIKDNYVRGLGGGIYCDSAVIINNTIIGNYSSAASFDPCVGGISCGSSAVIVNTILWENRGHHSVQQINEGANVTYSDIQGGYAGEGNINKDPLFTGDYHLHPSSPCIDTGNNDAPHIPQKDKDGKPRTIDGNGDGEAVVDMGTYEFGDICEGDFDGDLDVDGSDLTIFASDFGRTDCSGDCEGDFDGDGDVDRSDLAIFADDFGRTDCPPLLLSQITRFARKLTYVPFFDRIDRRQSGKSLAADPAQSEPKLDRIYPDEIVDSFLWIN